MFFQQITFAINDAFEDNLDFEKISFPNTKIVNSLLNSTVEMIPYNADSKQVPLLWTWLPPIHNLHILSLHQASKPPPPPITLLLLLLLLPILSKTNTTTTTTTTTYNYYHHYNLNYCHYYYHHYYNHYNYYYNISITTTTTTATSSIQPGMVLSALSAWFAAMNLGSKMLGSGWNGCKWSYNCLCRSKSRTLRVIKGQEK